MRSVKIGNINDNCFHERKKHIKECTAYTHIYIHIMTFCGRHIKKSFSIFRYNIREISNNTRE